MFAQHHFGLLGNMYELKNDLKKTVIYKLGSISCELIVDIIVQDLTLDELTDMPSCNFRDSTQ